MKKEKQQKAQSESKPMDSVTESERACVDAKDGCTDHVEAEHKSQIEASWFRCEQFGLDHGSEPDFGTLPQGELHDLLDQHRSLLETTENEVLPYYENILNNSSCMIVLADHQGHVLNTWGKNRFGRDDRYGQSHGLVGGNQWTEEGVGTNAIGTALITGQAIQVGRDEHFLRANRFMVGSASPIYDSQNDVVGVLDISSDAYLPQDHTLGMVKLMSLSVENRLIFAAFQKDYFILTFNTNLISLDSHWSGVLVLDENGTIVSANRRAEVVLARDLALLNIAQVFDCEMREIKHQPTNIPMKLKALGRYQFYVNVLPPALPVMRIPDFRKTEGYVAPETTLSEPNAAPRPEPAKEKRLLPENVVPLEELEHGDEKVRRVVKQAHKIMEKDIPILIHGETGAGKEIFVRSLHYHSSRQAQMLVAVNCAAIPSELVESELFGYEKGAFTGAQSKGSIGLIRRAHKGTLFLDEIGEMPMAVQSRLLRVLQERVVTPLGSTDVYPVDVKLISATNRQLKQEVHEGRFRQDLYYRISGLNIELPSLRDRMDKREVISYIHDRLRLEDPAPLLTGEMLTLLSSHPWPGNMRQLVYVLKVGMAMADGDVLEDWHLPDDFFDDLQSGETDELLTSNQVEGEKQESLEVKIPKLLERFNGNVSKTAKAAGVSRNTVYKYMKNAAD
ncbi:sigma-54-dependent Fis family transcriptional regulator [Marinomonas mediterranea]|uniref:sigma-54-dependent Fis family transcriptional regulator n=1 Tax=Marinomonas mediterranea TaxID=119864 RepID=UPI00234A05E9|nr:sigma-54-dependent Fis family transcriptional regulator [Marinomonas mediterranea]WCN07769.1 GAF domain-containing protein [Marinomonas mediterranea]